MGKKFKIVRKVAVIDSLDTMADGEKVTLECKEFASYNSVVTAIMRLNKRYGYEAFTYVAKLNCTVFEIERHKAS